MGTYVSAQNVTLTCNDGSGSGCAATYYCLGTGCTPTPPYTGPVTVSSTTTLSFFSTDADGNTEQVRTYAYTIDPSLAYRFERLWPQLQQPWYFTSPQGITVDSGGNIYIVEHTRHRIQKFDSSGTYVTAWGGKGSGNGQFSSPYDAVVDPAGNVYISDTYNHRIQKFTASGSFITSWGAPGSGAGQFNTPMGIAVDTAGYVYVADTGNKRIQKFTTDGTYVTVWGTSGSGTGQFSSPQGIAIDLSGNVYVVDSGNNRIQKFTSSGTYISTWGTSGSSNGQFNSPQGITVGASNTVYVTDSSNHRIQKFTTDGTFLSTWGSYGSTSGKLSFPSRIAITSNGNLIVADSQNNRVQIFTTGGVFQSAWNSYGSIDGQFKAPSAVVKFSDGFYVADTDNNRIQKFDANGSFVTAWGSYGSGTGQFNRPYGIAVDADGNVLVADANNNRIQKFDANGVFVAAWGSYGSGFGQLSSPTGIATDSANNVYVVDNGNHRIQKFTSYGALIDAWGSNGSGLGQFSYPQGIAVDGTNNVYVADSQNRRVQKFSADGTFIATWGTFGTGNGQFYNPAGITVDLAGNVYVTDTGLSRIQKFTSNGSFLAAWGGFGSGNGQLYAGTASTLNGICTDLSGNVYVADTANNRIQLFRPFLPPDSPRNVIATTGNGQAMVSFTAPAFTGGSPIASYTVTSNPGNFTATATVSPITVTGLTNGTPYTFTVTATNAAGTSPASTPSNSVNPSATDALVLTVSGSGTVHASPAPDINCTTSCGQAYASGTVVTLTPVPSANAEFGSWTGCDSVSNDLCTVTVSGLRYVTAIFTPRNYSLTASVTAGNGTITPATATVTAGGSQTFTITPGSSQQIVSFFDNGIAANPVYAGGNSYSYHLNNVSADHAILVGFASVASATSSSTINSARSQHTATLLQNGNVLITGGSSGSGRLGSAELYDPAMKTYTFTGAMTSPRGGHAATLLPDGRVLITGGIGSSYAAVATAEIFNPANGNFTTTGSMNQARCRHTATLLANGKVLIAGGQKADGSALSSAAAELYDPATGTFTNIGSLLTQRGQHTATSLENGKVLIVGGGTSGSYLASAEIFDPQTAQFTGTSSLNAARNNHTATLLVDGRVLVTGGIGAVSGGSSAIGTVEVFDPVSGQFTFAGTLASAKQQHTASLLHDGTVLITGGLGGSAIANIERFNPTTGQITSAGTMITGRYGHSATILQNGDLLVSGGSGSSYLNTAELYSFMAVFPGATVSGLPASPTNSTSATLTVSGNGVVAYRYRIDTGNFSGEIPVASPITMTTLADQTHSVSVLGKDGAGNWQIVPTTVSWLIDTTAPTTSPSPGGGTYVGSQNVSLNCGDVSGSGCAATYYCVGSGCTPATPYSGAISLTSSGDLLFYSVDKAGNSEPVKTATFDITIQTPPGTPTNVSATAGNGQSTVSFTAPVSNGGSAITSYTVTSSPGNIIATGSTSPITVTGLSNGTTYTFTVSATNAIGTGAASPPSNSVTPVIPTYSLTLTVTGTGTVHSTPAPDINCSVSCGQSYDSGTVVNLTATPGSNYYFSGWSGACSGSGSCSVTMSQARSVTATFASALPGVPTVVTATAGNGQATVNFTAPVSTGGSPITSYTVTSNPGNVTASGPASPITVTGLINGTPYTFTVTATNANGTGAASSPSNSVTPVVPTYSLALTVTGSGTVHSTPTPDINCTGTCGQSYASGTVVTLTAAPDSGNTFSGWSGACSGSGSCSVTMSQARSVTATFTNAGINGICGSANNGTYATPPATNLCTQGTASNLTGVGPWDWSCSGMNGGVTAYCSTARGGGITYRSGDAGSNWTAGQTGFGFGHWIFSMAASPAYSSDQTLLMGIDYGIYKSTDRGTTWTLTRYTNYAKGIAFSPTFANDRTVFAGVWVDGVYKSTDGGTTWNLANTGLPNQLVNDVAVSPDYDNDHTLFTALYTKGVYKSTDSGTTWSAANSGIDNITTEALAISPTYTSDHTLFAATTDSGGHVYKSTTGGATWSTADTGLVGSVTSIAISSAYASDQTLFALTSSGLYKSIDAGSSWVQVKSTTAGSAIVLSPAYASDQTIFLGISGDDVYRSSDGGSSWSPTSSGILPNNRKFSVLAISPDFATDRAVFTASIPYGPVMQLPVSLSFGDTVIGKSPLPQQLTIANNLTFADSNLEIRSIYLTGMNANQFIIAPGTCGSLSPIIPVGSSCSLDISFNPTFTGNKSATVEIVSNNNSYATDKIALSGNGIAGATSTITSPAVDFPTFDFYAIKGGSATVVIGGTASCLAGDTVALVEISVDGGAWQAATGTTSWSKSVFLPAEGVYSIKSRATTANGIVESLTGKVAVLILVDQTPPSGTLFLDAGGWTLNANANDHQACLFYYPSICGFLQMSTDGANWQPATTTPGTGGPLWLRDQAGNTTILNGNTTYNLSIGVSGTGTVHSSQTPDINCSGSCSQAYTSNALLTLSATPGSGYIFSGWSGACNGSGSCSVTMTQARSVTATFTYVLPGAPTGVTATAGNGQATVSFTAPVSNGGSAITGYTVTSSPGGYSATSSGSPIIVTGLTNGTAYTFTVTANNANGTGTASSPSSSVTPTSGLTASSTITSPAAIYYTNSTSVAVSGTATCSGGCTVSLVEVSADNGVTWQPATGTTSWSASIPVPTAKSYTIKSRATTSEGLIETPSSGITVIVYRTPPAASLALYFGLWVLDARDSMTFCFERIYPSICGQLEMSFNGNNWQPATTNLISGNPLWLRDRAGNTAYISGGSVANSIGGPLRIDGGSYYSFLQHALNAAGSGNTIKLVATALSENLTLTNDAALTIKGGYDSNLGSVTGITPLNGNLAVQAGSLTIENIAITGTMTVGSGSVNVTNLTIK